MNGTTPTAGRAAAVTYDRMAPFYDEFTAHHDYELWVTSLLEVVARSALTGQNRLLDVGCGTGKSFLPMLERGWRVTGCDLSPRMLEVARRKVGAAARLEVADVRELPIYGEFDLVWCLDDVLNYVADADELEVALRGLRANLAVDGVLLFDLNTLASYRGFFAQSLSDDHGATRWEWRGMADRHTAAASTIEAVFEAVEGEGSPVVRAIHRQRHFTQEEVAGAIARAGLELLEVYGHGEDARLEQPLDEARHTKAIVLAQTR